MRRFAAFMAVFAFVLVLGTTQVLAANGPKNKDKDTHVQLLAINDFHGNLLPPSGSSGRITTGLNTTVDAGGAEYLATHIKMLREENPNTITVGAGDLIGATPLISGLFHDEPTIESMNLLGLDDRASATTSSTRASTSCCACRTVAATRRPLPGRRPLRWGVLLLLAANVVYAGHEQRRSCRPTRSSRSGARRSRSSA